MVFVYYLDECNSALWKLFFVSLWLASLLASGYFGLKLLSIRGDIKSLENAGITGSTFEMLRPKPARRITKFAASLTAVIGILLFYVATFSDFECTADSVFWVGS